MNHHERLSDRISTAIQTTWARQRTRDYSAQRARHICKLLGNPRVSSIDPLETNTVLLASGIKAGTLNRYLRILKSLRVPVKYVEAARSEGQVLSEQQLSELDTRVRAHPDNLCAAFYAFLRDSGCRGLTEFRRFSWPSCDFSEGTFELTAYKGRQITRTVPMTDISRRALSWLYHDRTPITNSRWRKFWSQVRLDSRNVPYDLRHTYCTRLLDSGVSSATVMGIMGHTSIEQTESYYHQSPDALRRAAKALDSNEIRRDPTAT